MILTNKLTELVTIQRLSTSGNTFGAVVETWIDYGNYFMSLLNQKGNTTFQDQNIYNDSISFYGRYLPLTKKGYRVLYKNQVYELRNVTPIQRNQAIILDCVSVE